MLFLLSIKYVEPVKFEQRTDMVKRFRKILFDGIMLDASLAEKTKRFIS